MIEGVKRNLFFVYLFDVYVVEIIEFLVIGIRV